MTAVLSEASLNPKARHLSGRAWFWTLAVLGLVATSLIAVSAPGYATPSGRFWRPSLVPGLSRHVSVPHLGTILFYLGLVGICLLWLALVRAAHLRTLTIRQIVFVFALWCIPILLGPPLLSQDIYSYVAQGEMSLRGMDPSTAHVAALGPGTFRSLVPHIWRQSPTPYGSLAFVVSAGTLWLAGRDIVGAVFLWRFVIMACVAGLGYCIYVLARQLRVPVGPALALGLANPIVLLHLVGGAHNDALMLVLLVAALALAYRGKRPWGIFVATLAAAVKLTGLVAVVHMGWNWLSPEHVPFRKRVLTASLAVLASVAILLAIAELTGLGRGWLSLIDSSQRLRSTFAPSTTLGVLFAQTAQVISGARVDLDTFVVVFRLFGFAAMVLIAVGLLVRSHEIGEVKAIALTFLAIAVLGPVIHGWYLVAAIVLLGVAGGPKWKPTIIVLSIASVFFTCPDGQIVLTGMGPYRGLASFTVLVVVVTAIMVLRYVPAAGRVLGLGPDERTDSELSVDLTAEAIK